MTQGALALGEALKTEETTAEAGSGGAVKRKRRLLIQDVATVDAGAAAKAERKGLVTTPVVGSADAAGVRALLRGVDAETVVEFRGEGATLHVVALMRDGAVRVTVTHAGVDGVRVATLAGRVLRAMGNARRFVVRAATGGVSVNGTICEGSTSGDVTQAHYGEQFNALRASNFTRSLREVETALALMSESTREAEGRGFMRLIHVEHDDTRTHFVASDGFTITRASLAARMTREAGRSREAFGADAAGAWIHAVQAVDVDPDTSQVTLARSSQGVALEVSTEGATFALAGIIAAVEDLPPEGMEARLDNSKRGGVTVNGAALVTALERACEEQKAGHAEAIKAARARLSKAKGAKVDGSVALAAKRRAVDDAEGDVRAAEGLARAVTLESDGKALAVRWGAKGEAFLSGEAAGARALVKAKCGFDAGLLLGALSVLPDDAGALVTLLFESTGAKGGDATVSVEVASLAQRGHAAGQVIVAPMRIDGARVTLKK